MNETVDLAKDENLDKDHWCSVPQLSAERLPPQFRKHVDASSPLPLRGMAAKGLVPFHPADMCHCLAMLASDTDHSISATAKKTAAELPDKILLTALRDEGQNPRTLDFFFELHKNHLEVLEVLALNNATADFTISKLVATTVKAKIIDIIANNQLRILRSQEILRALVRNPASSQSLVDMTCDFVVRNGLCLQDIPSMVQAYHRIYGTPPPLPGSAQAQIEQQNSAESIMEEFGDSLGDLATPMEEGKRISLSQRISKMNVAEKVKLATLGNREARTLLMRDTNKIVTLAVINSPCITEAEVLTLAHSKTCPEDVLRSIYTSREWTRYYPIKIALVKNPKTPLSVSMRFLITLRDSDVKEIANNKNVPSAIRIQAKKNFQKKS